MKKKVFVIIFIIVIFIIGSIFFFFHNQRKQEIINTRPQEENIESNVITSHASWYGQPWMNGLTNEEKESVKVLRFVNSNKNLVYDKRWEFDGMQCYLLDTKDTIVIYVKDKVKICGDFRNAFANLEYIELIEGLNLLDISMVDDLSYLFSNSTQLKSIDLAGFDISHVKNVNRMFYHCESLEKIDLSILDFENTKTMNGLLEGCSNLSYLTLPNTTKNVVDMSRMLYGVGNGWFGCEVSGKMNTASVKTMEEMFSYSRLINYDFAQNFDVGQVETLNNMFSYSSIKQINLSSWDTSKCTDFSNLFMFCEGLTSCDMSNINIASANTFQNMFYRCICLNDLNVSFINTKPVILSTKNMFYDCFSLQDIDCSFLEDSKIGNAQGMFAGASELSDINVEIVADVMDDIFRGTQLFSKEDLIVE